MNSLLIKKLIIINKYRVCFNQIKQNLSNLYNQVMLTSNAKMNI